MKKYIKANDEITISKSELNSLVRKAVEEFTECVEDVASEYNYKHEIKFAISDTALVFDDDDSAQYKITLEDQDGEYVDLYVDLIFDEDGEEWMLASDMYDRTDDYYEQAYMYLDE